MADRAVGLLLNRESVTQQGIEMAALAPWLAWVGIGLSLALLWGPRASLAAQSNFEVWLGRFPQARSLKLANALVRLPPGSQGGCVEGIPPRKRIGRLLGARQFVNEATDGLIVTPALTLHCYHVIHHH
jgi:hypothetical protein